MKTELNQIWDGVDELVEILNHAVEICERHNLDDEPLTAAAISLMGLEEFVHNETVLHMCANPSEFSWIFGLSGSQFQGG